MIDLKPTFELDAFSPQRFEAMEGKMLALPQVKTSLKHHFAPGVYVREWSVPAGSGTLGHEHKTECINIMLKGKALVMVDGVQMELVAGAIFNSAAGVRKAAIVIEDMVWLNVFPNPTNERDPEKLLDMFGVKSETWLKHHKELSNGS